MYIHRYKYTYIRITVHPSFQVAAAAYRKTLSSIGLFPTYEVHCRQTTLSSCHCKWDSVGAGEKTKSEVKIAIKDDVACYLKEVKKVNIKP